MNERIVIAVSPLLNPDYQTFGRPARYRVLVIKLVGEMTVGHLDCEISDGQCQVLGAKVEPDFRRLRYGHEMMFELERRWPGVTTAPPQNIAASSVPDWHAQKAEIMRTGDPHLGRSDLPAYVPTQLPDRIIPAPAPPPASGA